MTSFKAALEIDHRSFVFIAAARACTSWRSARRSSDGSWWTTHAAARNLWPEPYNTQIDGQTVGARQKDTVENYIHNAICFDVPGHKSHGTAAHSSMTLQRAQEILAGDWYACNVTVKKGQDCK
jgi:hypothetical protein